MGQGKPGGGFEIMSESWATFADQERVMAEMRSFGLASSIITGGVHHHGPGQPCNEGCRLFGPSGEVTSRESVT